MSFLDREQKLFEASKILDDADAQMVEVRTQGRPFFFAIGRARHRSEEPAANVSAATAQAKLDKKNEKELSWDFLFEPSNIPGFMQIDQFKTLAALIASVSSRTMIGVDHATFTPTLSFGGADVRWETTQLVTKYLDSIECTNHALDKGPELEFSHNAKLAQIYFSLKNVSLKKMRIASMSIDVNYTEFESRGSGLCGVIINQVKFEEEYKSTADDQNGDIRELEKKLRTEFAEILAEFVTKRISNAS